MSSRETWRSRTSLAGMSRKGAAPPGVNATPKTEACWAVSITKHPLCGPLMMAPGCVSTRRGSCGSYFRDVSSARLMMMLMVPVGRTRSRSCACTRPSYRQISSTKLPSGAFGK